MTTIQTQVPDRLYRMASLLVEDGWYRNEDDIFTEALRRFLDTHRPELMEKFVRDDLEWGLHGDD